MYIFNSKENISYYWENTQAWIVIFSAASFLFLINILINIFNSVTPHLLKNPNFNTSKIGFLFACYYYSNILFVFPAGILLDKISLKKSLLISFIIANINILILAVTSSLYLIALSRLSLGITGAFSLLICLKLIKHWFPSQKTTLITGIVLSFVTLGRIFAQTPVILAIKIFGWENGLLLNFCLGMLLLILAAIFVQDHPPEDKKVFAKSQATFNIYSIWEQIKKVITNFQNWVIGIYISLSSLPILFFGASWGNLYLQQTYSLTEIQSSYIISSIFVGLVVGSPVMGWISDKFNIPNLLLIASTVCMIIILLIVILFTYSSLSVLTVMFFMLGFMSSSQLVCYPLIMGNNCSNLTGAAIGFVTTLGNLCGIYTSIFGWLIGLGQSHIVINGIPHYSTYNYYLAMIVLISAVIFSLLLLILLAPISISNGDSSINNTASLNNKAAE